MSRQWRLLTIAIVGIAGLCFIYIFLFKKMD